jgi:hypothetical protein
MSATTFPRVEALRDRIDLQPGEKLYGVVDAAQDAEFALEAERRFGAHIRTLFVGETAQYIKEVAPYLVPIDPGGEYLNLWAQRWGKNVGVFLTTSADLHQLWRHLREIFVVEDETGQEYFFRFYDPRVLRAYLPTCTADEAKEFFGPIGAFLSEGSKPGTLLRFTPGPDGALETTMDLPPASSVPDQ